MKRRVVIEFDDEITTQMMNEIGGCEDAFGLTMLVCRDPVRLGPEWREMISKAMSEAGITLVSNERIS